ncbi:hypothetical protein JCM11491_002852 [Sporobolomyces phaffii]
MSRLLEWIPPRDQLQPLGAVPALLPPVLLVALLVSRPHRWLNLTVLPVFVAYSVYTALYYTMGAAPDDYGRASLQFTLVLRAIDAFLLATPSFDVAFKRHPGTPTSPPWTWKRLAYAIKFATTLRGAGWEWQVVKTRGPTTSRTAFLQRRLAKALLMYLALDVTSTYMQSRPYFHRVVPLAALSRSEHLANMLAACASAGLALNTVYQLVCIVCVASRAWAPDECIDLFGSVLSRPCSISCAFFLSALLHAFSSFAMARTGLGSFKFFCVQPLGILLESMVRGLGGRNDGKASARSVIDASGYAWTAGWLLYWCPLFFDELVQAGFWEVDAAPFSVVRGVWRGEWLHV